jgi:CRP/FNR family cyclic AMP-dependent transcriptional regulator
MSAVLKTYKSGQVIFKEGDPSNCVYLIKSGTISVRKKKGSEFLEVARIHPKEILGELSFFDRQPRSATAVAISPSEVHEIPFDALDKIYDSVPPYMKAIISSLADRLRKANDQIRRLQDKTFKSTDEDIDPSVAALEAELTQSEPKDGK